MTWTVDLVPHTEYDEESGKNQSGLKVQIINGVDAPKEMCRVAFSRRHAVNRTTTFKKVLLARIADAQTAADGLNEAEAKAVEARLVAGREKARVEREHELAVAAADREHRRQLEVMRSTEPAGVV